MKIEDVNLDKVYYFIYSNHKIPAILIPIDVIKSGLGKDHFWTEGYFYDSQEKKWYYEESNWTIGNKNYIEIDKVSEQIMHESISSIFEKGIKEN